MSRDKQPRLGVALLVYIHGNHLILGKRGRGGNAGKWVLPGGGVKLGEHWRAAGEREYLEETSLRVKIQDNDALPLHIMEIIGEDSHRVCLVARAKLVSPWEDMRTSDELTEIEAFAPERMPVQISIPVLDCLIALELRGE